jgi:micrococcal nuclease
MITYRVEFHNKADEPDQDEHVSQVRYGRALGKVQLEGKNINDVQSMRGFAWFYRGYAKDLSTEDAKAYEQAEQIAWADKRGLWADPSPAAPWEFRKGQRTPVPKSQSAPNGQVIGNRNTNKYHRPDCPDYSNVAERNRVYFKTPAEAKKAGYKVGGNCPRQ